MKTLTVDEAVAGLGKWLDLAMAGEEVQIQQGEALVELRPARPDSRVATRNSLAPREALRRLQQAARLTAADAESYLHEVRAERLAAEDRRLA